MGVEDLTQPRFVLAAMALLLVGILVGMGRVDQSAGLMLITGILVAFGAYARSERAQTYVRKVRLTAIGTMTGTWNRDDDE